jgi:hypothetical protein
MGHLFYSELGGSNNTTISGVHNASYSFFHNLQDGTYWSDTTYSVDTSAAWVFQFQNGSQTTGAKPTSAFYVLAVLTGDVASPKVLPQIAFGGGWYSALYFTMSGSGNASFQVNFVNADGTPLVVPSLGAPFTTVSLVGRGTAFVEMPNTGPLRGLRRILSPPASQATRSSGQTWMAARSGGRGAASSASSTTSTLLMGDMNPHHGCGYRQSESGRCNIVTVTARDAQGRSVGNPARVMIPANGRVAMALRDLPGLGSTVGNRGTAEFTVTTGNVAVLGLRFRLSSFTSIPTQDK